MCALEARQRASQENSAHLSCVSRLRRHLPGSQCPVPGGGGRVGCPRQACSVYNMYVIQSVPWRDMGVPRQSFGHTHAHTHSHTQHGRLNLQPHTVVFRFATATPNPTPLWHRVPRAGMRRSGFIQGTGDAHTALIDLAGKRIFWGPGVLARNGTRSQGRSWAVW